MVIKGQDSESGGGAASILKAFLKKQPYNEKHGGKGSESGGRGFGKDKDEIDMVAKMMKGMKGKAKGGGGAGAGAGDDWEKPEVEDTDMAQNMAQLLQAAFMKGAKWGAENANDQWEGWIKEQGGKGAIGKGGRTNRADGVNSSGWEVWKEGKIDDAGGEIGEFHGKLKSFSEKSGFGFIESPDITALGYKDVFVHHAQVMKWKPGQYVTFTAYLNSKGMPQGKNLTPGFRPNGEMEVEGEPVSKGPFVEDNSGGDLGECVGMIKSFNEKTGYGFIACQALTDAGYGDAFLHNNQKQNFQVGQWVKFSCYLTKESKPQAKSLEDAGY